jgi:hypothetical protein
MVQSTPPASPVQMYAGSLRHYVVLGLFSALLAWIGFDWLPIFGIDIFADLFSPRHVLGIILLFVGGLLYLKYIHACLDHPSRFLLVYCVLLPWFTFLCRVAAQHGANFPQTALMAVLFCLPVFLMTWRYAIPMLQQVPMIRYYAILWGVMLVNLLFFDHAVFDATAQMLGKQSVSIQSYTPITLTLISLFLGSYVAYREEKILPFLNAVNKTAVLIAVILSLTALICYPLQLFTVTSEGVPRMGLIFFHPNHFAMYQSFLLIYMLGMYFHYLSMSSERTIQKILLVTIVFGFLALITTFSKNAIASFAVGAILLVALNLQLVRRKRFLVIILVLLPVLLVGGLWTFQLVTNVNLVEKFLFRVGNTSSMEWRLEAWRYIFEDIDWSNVLFGHGFSAASERMALFQRSLPGSTFKVLQVHNDYLMLLYDFGLAGLIIHIWLLSVWCLKLFAVFKAPVYEMSRPLDVTAICMITAYFICNATDNCFVMLETPFWILLLILFVTSERIKRQTSRFASTLSS